MKKNDIAKKNVSIIIPQKVIWKPQPKQEMFMRQGVYEAMYGGSAGGGKSDALLAEALRQVHIPHYRGLILRKTYPQLSELVDRSREIYKPAYPKARWNDNKHVWTFPSGAKIFFGSMHHKKDRIKYQGKRFDYIAFDEGTHFTWEEYSYMFSRNRPGGPGTRVYIRMATNPGGIGHGWVKERFISGKTPGKTYYGEHKVITPEGKLITLKRGRVFIPSNVFDNKILMENDPNYIANLAMLPEEEKNALLYGDWDSFEGQVFTEWKDDHEHYGDMLFTHVIDPFKIPREWKRFRTFDFGYSKPFSVGWWAMDYDGRLYRYRELYGSTGEPNVGVKWTPQKIAETIRDIEKEHEGDNYIQGFADPSIWDKSRGESIAETLERYGIYFEPAENKRIPGKMQFHYRLAFDENGKSMVYIFNTCKDFIRTIPTLIYDDTNPEDINTDMEDHIYDEARYLFAMNPIAPRKNVLAPDVQYNPLSSNTIQRDQYGFIRL